MLWRARRQAASSSIAFELRSCGTDSIEWQLDANSNGNDRRVTAPLLAASTASPQRWTSKSTLSPACSPVTRRIPLRRANGFFSTPRVSIARGRRWLNGKLTFSADRRIDFAAIVTPNHAHFGPAKTFLEHGFHVICDKPLTTTIEEANQLVQLVERTQCLVFAVTYNYTGYPLIRHAKQLFRSGEMGVVRKVPVQYLQGWLVLPEENRGSKQAAWRTNPEQSGVGGAIGDIGTHALHLVEYVTGDPVVELCADKSTFLPDRTLDEDVNALLRFRGGGKGVLTVSQIATGEENALRLRIYASKGAILWEQENPNYLSCIDTVNRARRSPAAAPVPFLLGCGGSDADPVGASRGYLEAFANIYLGAIHAIRCHVDGAPIPRQAYAFPSVYDGCRGVQVHSPGGRIGKRRRHVGRDVM